VTVKALVPILICLSTLLPRAARATDLGTSGISVTFAPEVELKRESSMIHLKIRLSEKGSAQIWLADNCSERRDEGNASYLVCTSGEFEIPMANVPGQGSRLCLKSSDRLTAEASSGQPAALAEAKQ